MHQKISLFRPAALFLVLTLFLAPIVSSTASAYVGEKVAIEFDGTVTSVGQETVSARINVTVTDSTGKVTTGRGVIEFHSNSGAKPKVGETISGDVVAKIVWQTSGDFVVADIVDGQWYTKSKFGDMTSGRVIWEATGDPV